MQEEDMLKDAVIEHSEVEQEQNPTESATVSEQEREYTPEDVGTVENQEEVSEKAQKRFNKLTAEKYELKAQIDAERKAREELQAEIEKLRTTSNSSSLKPPHPDLAYENPDLYDQKMSEYQLALYEQTQRSRQDADKQERYKAEAEKAAKTALERLQNSATELGIDFAEVDQSAAVLMRQGLSPVLRDAIIDHEASAALIAHLAKNPADFDEVNSLISPIAITRKLDAIRNPAIQRKTSGAPDPQRSIKGLSAKEPDEFDKALPGAVIISSR